MDRPIERMEWEDHEKGTFFLEEEVEIFDEERKKQIGTKKITTEVDTTAENIQAGMDIVKERTMKNENKLKQLEKQLIGSDKKMLTNEQIRLKVNLEALQKSEKRSQALQQIEPIKVELEADRFLIESREKILKERPEK